MTRSLIATGIFLATLPLALLAAALTLPGDGLAALIGRLRRLLARPAPLPARRDPTRASIIILNWNGRDLLAQGLPSVVEAVRQAGGEHEIIVVDNGSTDGSVELVREDFPAVQLLALERNLGFGRGNNLGVQAAKHDIVVLLNNDMLVEPDFLPPLLQPFGDVRVFAVSAQIMMSPDRQRVESGRTCASIEDGLLRAWHAPLSPADQDLRPCLWAGGGSAAFDRQRFLQLGGFAALYEPFYVEDLDLSYRAWKQGWTVLLAPQSVVHHRHRASTSRLGADYVEQAMAKNSRLFVWRNVTDARQTLAALLRLPGDIAAAWQGGQSNERRALLWAMRQMPAALARRWRSIAATQRGAPDDAEVLRGGGSRFFYRERFAPPPPKPDDGRLSILMLCPYLPVPPAHGGAVRMLNLIKNLSRSNNVDVLSFVDREEELANAPLLEPSCRRLRLVVRRPPYGRYRPLHDRSWHIEEFDCPEMQQALLEMLDAEDYHVLQVEYAQLAQYLPPTRRMTTALDEVDVFFRTFYRQRIQRQRATGRVAWQDVLDYLKLARDEIQSCRRFDHILAMSDDDAAFLARYLPEKRRAITTIANGVDTGYYTPPAEWPGGDDVLFIGSYRHTPNQQGMRWFLADVWPLIRHSRPDAHLYIVGDGPWAEEAGIAGDESITATGFVDDTRPYLSGFAVSLAPILSGSGTRIKILDSLAAGIPVVSTTLGCEGIAARHDDHVLLADTPADFATAVVTLLGDPDLAERLRRNGRRLAEEMYDWQAIAHRLNELYTRGSSA